MVPIRPLTAAEREEIERMRALERDIEKRALDARKGQWKRPQ